MKVLLVFTSFLLVLLLPIFASAEGAKDGGGGGVVLCPAGSGRPAIQLLDLAEYQGTRAIVAYGSVEEQLRVLLAYVSQEAGPQSSRRLQRYIRLAQRSQKLVDALSWSPEDANLDQAKAHALRLGCRYQRIAYFDDRLGRLEVLRGLHQKLSSTDSAALIVHEAIYRMYRERVQASITVSNNVREVVGLLFHRESLGLERLEAIHLLSLVSEP